MAGTKDIKDFTKYPSLSDNDYLIGTKSDLGGTDAGIKVSDFKKLVAQDIKPEIKNGYWWVNGINTGQLAIGRTPKFRYTTLGLEMKYEDEDDTAYLVIIPIEDLLFTFDDLTPEQVELLKLKFSDLTDADKETLRGAAFTFDMFTPEQLADLRMTWEKLTPDQKNEIKGERGYSAFEVWTQQEGNTDKTIDDYLAWLCQPATDAAAEVRKEMTQISQEVNQAITDTNAAKDAANTAAVNAKSVSDHPGYIGNDYHVYTWDYVTGAYNKTDTVLRPEGFSIYRTYATIAAMNADLSNVPEGKFVLINTGSVDDEDTAKLYVKGAANFEYLVDMSGAIGFTGKTPQITIGTVTVGSSASASLPPDGTDDNGNPKFKLNLVIVAGPQGLTPIIEMGTTTTGQPGTDAVATLAPNGQTSDGRDKYLLNLTIPQGLPGTGSGNVLVPGPGLVSGKKYLFVPSGNDSTVGTFVEYVVPEAYDDTEVRRLIGEKVDKVVGKQLTTEDFTTLLKQKLEGLTNYNDATLTAELNNLKARLDALIGTSASAAIDTFNEITAFLAGITDTQSLTTLLSGLRTDIVALIPTKTSDLTNDSGFVSDASYVHTDNNYTTTDKNKLSGIAASANNYVHPTTAGNKHIPAGGTSGQILRWSADGTAVWGVDNDTTYSPATETTNGLMSSDDKTKLDRIGSYTTATTVANLNANYENIEVSLNANASLSVNAAGRNYDGLEMNVLVYCPSTQTITIPTSGNYESMCGSSHTCPAGRRVEFNLKCYVGIWHIAKLEQQ